MMLKDQKWDQFEIHKAGNKGNSQNHTWIICKEVWHVVHSGDDKKCKRLFLRRQIFKAVFTLSVIWCPMSILVIHNWIKWKEKVFWLQKKRHLKPSESMNHWNLSEEGEIISRAVIQSQSYRSFPLFNV